MNTGHLPNGTAPKSGVMKRWQFSTFADLKFTNAPVVAGETLFLAARDFNLYAIDVTSGQLRWKHNTGSELLVTPAVGESLVYLPTGDGHVKAFGIESGKKQWSFDHPHGTEHVPSGRVTYADGIVFPPESPLLALNATDGSVRWRRNLHPGFGVAVADRTVYVSEGDTNRVYAFALEDGSRQWRQRIDSRTEPVVSPVISGGVLYLVTLDNTLYALDVASGTTRWTYQVGGGETFPSTPAVAGDTVYIGETPITDGHPSEQRGAVHAVNAETGERRWRFETPGSVVDSPSVVDGVVYAGSFGQDDAKRFHAIDALSGEPLWQYPTQENVSAHAIANGTVYLTTRDGYIHAFKESESTGTSTTTATESDTTPTPAPNEESPISIDSITLPETITRGESFEIGVAVTNTGSQTVTPVITYAFETETVLTKRDEPIAAGESEQFVFPGITLKMIETSLNETVNPGEYTHSIGVADGPRRSRSVTVTNRSATRSPQSPASNAAGSDQERQRGFFTNDGGEPGFLSNVFNLTVLGFLLSVAGVIHQLIQGR